MQEFCTIEIALLSLSLTHTTGVEMTYMKELVSKVARVTLSDLKKVAPTYLNPLFDPKSVRRSAVCKPASVIQISGDFASLGVDLVPVNLEDEANFVSKL